MHPQLLEEYASYLAQSLVTTAEGKRAGHWEWPVLRKPRVPGGAYQIATYTFFVMGCAVAEARDPYSESSGFEGVFIPGCESLAGYYLEIPEVKNVLDAHFKSSDEYAAKKLSPEVLEILGKDTRASFLETGKALGRGDETLLAIYWQLLSRGRPFSINESVDAYDRFFMDGTHLDISEIRRLWGVQAQTCVIPLMDMSLDEARDETVSEILQMPPQPPRPPTASRRS